MVIIGATRCCFLNNGMSLALPFMQHVIGIFVPHHPRIILF